MTPLRSRPLFAKLLTNTVWQLIDKVMRLIAGLLVGVWIARFLGPSSFGELNFAIAFAALFSPIADIGLQSIVVRELVMRPQDRQKILASAYSLRIVGAAVAATLCTICILFSRANSSSVQLMVVTIALAFFPQAWDVLDYDYQSRTATRPIVIIRCFSLFIFSAVKILLIKSGANVVWFAVAITGEAALSALVMRIFVSSKNLPPSQLRFVSQDEVRRQLRWSWPIAISGLSVMLYMRIDQVMLGQLRDDAAVGIFSAAVRVSECWYFFPMAVLASISPALTASYRDTSDKYRAQLVAFMRVVLSVSILIAVVFTFFASPIIRTLYGFHYDESAQVLKIHAWAGIFASLGVASNPWFLNNGMNRTRMIHTVLGAIANILMNAFMIPRYGAIGSAVATLVSYSLAAFWLNAFSRRTWPIFALQLRAVWLR